jgi:hypothetical protein
MAHPSFLARLWNALKNINALISLFVNLILIIVVLVLVSQIGAIKATLAGVLGQLDSAFEGLGKSSIVDTIAINQQVPVQFDLPIDQSITVVTQAPIPLSVPTTFSLGAFGTINGTVSLQIPAGTSLPVQLQLTVPVKTQIAVKFDQPVSINLYSKGLGKVVDKLRSALAPIINLVKDLPDRFVLIK